MRKGLRTFYEIKCARICIFKIQMPFQNAKLMPILVSMPTKKFQSQITFQKAKLMPNFSLNANQKISKPIDFQKSQINAKF